MKKRTGVYIVKTHVWYVERLVWLVAGTDVVVSSILTAYVNPNWAFSILFVGMCSLMVAFTGFCIVGNILVLLGARPMIPSTATPRSEKRQQVLLYADRQVVPGALHLSFRWGQSLLDLAVCKVPQFQLALLYRLRRICNDRLLLHRVLHHGEPPLSAWRRTKALQVPVALGHIKAMFTGYEDEESP